MIKKSKRVFSILLASTLLFSGINNGAYAKIYRSNDNIILNAEALVDENSINLNWNVDNPTQPYSYKVFKKRSDDEGYNSLGLTQTKDKVVVLNLYPEDSSIPLDTSYETWDGEHIEGLPQSARLKRWMEEPNIEDNRGYGKGVIEVIPVSMNDFNKSPNLYIIQKNDGYYTLYNQEEIKIDVVLIGNWDSAGHKPPANNNSISVLRNYILNNGSIIFGHDTVASQYNLNVFMEDIDVTKQNPESENGIYLGVGGTHIQSIKKGLILEKPWSISTDELIIPNTHTSRQMVKKSNVWIEFSRPDDGDSGHPNITERLIEYDNRTNNHYLTIKNNLAMIQTGHSKGQATADEQKILANTIFYMSQLSTTDDKEFKDTLGQDVSAPEKPIISSVDVDIDNKKIKIKGLESEDVGTDYSYYIEATGRNDGTIITSQPVEVNIETGLKGYSYVINANPNGVPDNEVDIKSIADGFEYNFTTSDVGQYYLHIKAIDNAGNFSETTHIKLSSLDYEVAVNNLEIAELNPTSDNIRIAREAINNLPESFVKDELQERLNNIFNMSDIVFEKYTATSNLDVYIKCENILQMSLDTNQISFDDFSGIEDMEKLNAVNITINSSLPYQINAYLPAEIQNSDKSVTMDKSILNIKESSETAYQTFINTTDKIVLKDNCSAGNQLTHGVDLKLAGGIAHEKDVYKAIIKLEVEQK